MYAFVEDHGQVRYLADSASADEIRRDKYGQYMPSLPRAAAGIGRHSATVSRTLPNTRISLASSVSLFVPGERRDGLRYVIGADIDVAYLQNRSHEALLTSLLIGGAILPFRWPCRGGWRGR